MLGSRRGLLVFLLIVVLANSVTTSGCNISTSTERASTSKASAGISTSQESSDAALDPIEISFFISDPGQSPTNSNKIYKLIKEKLGVTCKFEFLVGDKAQKIGVMLAAGDYPDVVTVDSDSVSRFTGAGALIPLEDLIAENAPNLEKHYEKYKNKVIDTSDNHFYVMADYGIIYGNYTANVWEGSAFWIQKAVLQEFGYPKVKTLDQYFDLIEKYKQKYPEIYGEPTIGFEILSDGWRNFCLKNPPEYLVGYPNDGIVVVNDKTNIADFFWDKDYAKRYYKKLNEVNSKGLIDPETFTMNYDQYMSKLSSGRVLGMFDQHWNYYVAEKALITDNKIERTYAPCPLVFDEKTKDHYYDQQVLNVNTGFALTKNCKNPKRVIKFFDALITEKWQKIIGWGIEGEDYFVNDKGEFYRNQEQREHSTDNAWILGNQAYTLWYYGPKIEGTYSDGNAGTPSFQQKEFYNSLKDYDRGFLKAYGYKKWTDFFSPAPENRVSYPAWQIDLVDGSSASMAKIKLEDIAVKYLPKAILTKPDEFEKVWDEYVNELHKCDIKSYLNRINGQLKWRADNWK